MTATTSPGRDGEESRAEDLTEFGRHIRSTVCSEAVAKPRRRPGRPPDERTGAVAPVVRSSGRETPAMRTAHRSRESIPPRSAVVLGNQVDTNPVREVGSPFGLA
jgi:hypothetical protein